MKKLKLNETQIKLLSIMYVNLILGMIIMATVISYNEMFTYGLWHKITTYPFYCPIGMIAYIILGIIIFGVIYFILKFDYNVMKFGLDYIKIKNKKNQPTNDILNDMESTP